MPKKLDNELMEYKEKIGADEFKMLYGRLYQEAKGKKRFSGEVYTNSPSRINAIGTNIKTVLQTKYCPNYI